MLIGLVFRKILQYCFMGIFFVSLRVCEWMKEGGGGLERYDMNQFLMVCILKEICSVEEFCSEIVLNIVFFEYIF